MTTLSLHGVSRIYNNQAIVDRLDLDLKSNEFLSLLGSSGCGKTTTLRMIAGFVDLSEGEIRVDGEVVSSSQMTRAPEKRDMSMIFQSYAVWPHMTVRQNVEFGLRLRKLARQEVTARAQQALTMVRLDALADRYPSELSGGQQQRVSLARAIVVRPKILLLDEPLSNLDATLREEMCTEIRRLHDQLGFTTLYVTHDQVEAMRASDRIAVMNQGRIEQIAAPDVLYAKPASEFVARFIGKTNILSLRRDADGLQIEGMPGLPLGHIASNLNPTQWRLSLRPHDITLHRERPSQHPAAIAVQVRERTYLGDTWLYRVAPGDGDFTLQVVTPFRQTFSQAQSLWASLDLDCAEVVKA